MNVLKRAIALFSPPPPRVDASAFGGPPRIVKAVSWPENDAVLGSIAGPKRPEGVSAVFECELVPEPPQSAKDVDRILVRAQGKVLARLGVDAVDAYFVTVAKQGQPGATLTGVKARIYGGWKTEKDEGAYLVDLIVPESLAYALSVRGRAAA